MAQPTSAVPAAVPAVPTIPIREWLPWAVFFAITGLLVLFFVSANQGAFGVPSGTGIHEFLHDARHMQGFPCH